MNAKPTALEFLKAVYCNEDLPLSVRMRAASEALPYEVPKLSATAILEGRDYATLLDARLARIAEPKLINVTPENPPVRIPPTIHDRRFRR